MMKSGENMSSPAQLPLPETRNRRRPGSLQPMSKRELIERIILINRSAKTEFLQSFSENELADYLRQLESIGPIEEFVPLPMAY